MATLVAIALAALASTATPAAMAAPEGPAGAGGGPSEESEEIRRSEALDLFDQSRQAYRAGQFARAAALLRKAYALHPSPVLLYNLARAEESAGHDDAALAAYRRYLEADPRARDRGAIEQRIATIGERIARREQAEQQRERAEARAQAAEQQAATDGDDGSSVLWPAIAIGAGGAGLVTGIVFAGLAKSDESAAHDEPSHAASVEAFERGEQYATVATVAFVAGGIVTGGGLVWLMVTLGTESSPSAAASLSLAPIPGGASISGRF